MENKKEMIQSLPLLPTRDIVVYPYMILPLFVGRKSSIKAVEEALNNHNRLIMLSCQKDLHAENPGKNDIFEVGTIAMIMRRVIIIIYRIFWLLGATISFSCSIFLLMIFCYYEIK